MRALVAVSGLVAVVGCATSEPAVEPRRTPYEMTITGSDFAFVAPDTVAAGVTNITFVNQGPNLHHVQFVRLDSGKVLADLTEAMKTPGPMPAWAIVVPGPNAPDPGASSNATVDLTEGNYAVLCLVDIPGGVPHFAMGMVRGLVVKTMEPTSIVQDSADVRLELAEYSFTLSKPLVAGRQVIEVLSTGAQPHEIEIVRFAPGKTLEDFGKWMAKPEGPPPGNAVGGTSAQMPGMKPRFTVDLTPGNYAMLCFVPDAKDGKPHLEHGMVQAFTIN